MRFLGFLLIALLTLAGCSKPVELGEIYIVDEYGGENEAIAEFVDSLGYFVEAASDGYAFLSHCPSGGRDHRSQRGTLEPAEIR
jgi:hypothetical protein